MADLTSVGVTSGIPSSGTGTVATINYLTQVGAPISNGSTVTPVTVAITGNASAVTSSMNALVVSLSPNSSVRTFTLSSNPTVIPSSVATVTLSSNPTVIPSSAIQVTLTSNTVALSSNPTVLQGTSPWVTSLSTASGANTVTLSSAINATTSISSALSVTPTSAVVVTLSTAAGANTVTLSSAINATATFSSGTFTLSSNPTVIPSSIWSVALSTASGANTVTLSSAIATAISSALSISSGTITLSSNPTVILSSNPTITSLSSGAVSITVGSNTANVLAGSSTVTSTMASLVVALSSNGAGIIGTGTPSTPSSQYISAVVVGDLAYGGSNSSASNPVAIGGMYQSSNPTAVTSGQRSQAWFDKVGRQISVATLRTLKGVQLTALSCTTTETNITPASSGGLFLDLYGLVIANQSSVNTQTVTIKDSSGGTSRMVFQVPSNDTRGFMLPVDAAVLQAATSQAWTATASNSSGPLQITAMYVSNA